MFSLVILLSTGVLSVWSHGFLWDPPARSTAWRIIPNFRECCTEYTDNQMFCGGVDRQYKTNGGKCGICGEPYDQIPKSFERGGAKYRGTSVKTYSQGQQIQVKVNLTANHLGFFEFRLCNVDPTPNSEATQDCLDRRILKLANSDSTKYSITSAMGATQIALHLQLPVDVSCNHCVFQWKYTAGNSWGKDSVTGQSGLGFGIENETFMGCADITIGTGTAPTNPPLTVISTNRPQSTTSSQPNPNGITTWSPNNVQYRIGDLVLYDGMRYRCIAAHTSFSGANPSPVTWAWWSRVI